MTKQDKNAGILYSLGTEFNVIQVNNQLCTIRVCEHDTSTTGIRYKLAYKLIVGLPLRIPKPRRYNGPIALNHKPKASKDLVGPWVLDIGNALYRQLGFTYTYNPSVERGKVTTFTYYFNDIDVARELGVEISDALYHAYKRHQDTMQAEGYPSFSYPHLRENKKEII